MRASPALLPRPRAQPWRPASSHMPWLNRDPTHRTEKTTGAGIFHAVEPDVASALTIRMHRVVFPRPHPLFAESDTGWGHRPAGWAAAAPRILGLTWVTGPGRRAGGRCGWRG